MNKIRILFFIPELEGGGAEKTVKNLITVMKKNYKELDIHQVVMHIEEGVKLADYIIPMKNDLRKAAGKARKILCKLKQIQEIKSIKREYKADVTISFLLGADIVNVLSKRKDNGKVILSLRNNPKIEIVNGSNIAVKLLYRYVIRKAEYVIALTRSVMKMAMSELQLQEDKIDYIYNPLPQQSISAFEPDLLKQLHSEGYDVVITAGRLEEQKGQWNLIKAFKLVLENRPKTKLVILGKGHLENELKRLVRIMGIEDNVYFLGFVSNVLEYVKYSDLFVLSSLYEGLGNILIEALSVGQAVISTDCPVGPREILDDCIDGGEIHEMYIAKYGILIPVGSTNITASVSDADIIMADAICKVLTDDKLKRRLKESALIRKKDFEAERIVKKWISVLQDVLGDEACRDTFCHDT